MVSSHKLQLFKHCSSIDPFHGVQSIRKKLLQCGSLMGHSSYFACVGSPWAAASLRAQPPAPAWDPPQAAMWISCLVYFSPWVAEGQAGPPWPTGESAAVPKVALLLH